MRRHYFLTGLLFMAACAYLDNLRGPLLPVLSRALDLPYGQSSWFFVAGNLAAVVCTFLLIPLSRFYGDRALAAGIAGLGVASACLASQIRGFPTLVLVAAIWGSAISMAGAISNVLVLKGSDPAARSRLFCGLHMMYGFGSAAGPGLVGTILAAGYAWQVPVLVLAPVFAVTAGWALRALPATHDAADMPPGAARLTRTQVRILLGFCAYVAGEVLISTWMSAYLVDIRKLAVEDAAKYLTGFFVTMGATRALCFLHLPPALELGILRGCLLLAGGFFALGHAGYAWALSLAGVLGPFFPLYMARVSREYPAQSRALTLWVLTSVQLTLVVFQLFLGTFADAVGLEIAYRLPLLMLLATLLILKR